MSEQDSKLVELAGRVSDGVQVDWDEAEQNATSDEERQVIRHLVLLESLASVHRNQATAEEERDAPEIGNSVSSISDTTEITIDDPGTGGIGTWGHLEIRQKIGEGAFGEVFRAWDRNLDREVALKLLKKETSAQADLASSVLKEGRLLARVRHPNVVTVHGAETHDERVGLWMEFVSGRSLAELLQEQGRLGAREAALVGLELCRAMAAVHGAGLVHRDIKARNVMREEGGRILLMDFGAGRDLNDIEGRQDRSISGTPLYIAPEVYAGLPATARADIYSLGVLLYHLVTGSYPVEAGSLDELREKHFAHRTTLLRDIRSDLPEAFVNVVECALACDPQDRFATAGQMEQALSAALGVESTAAEAGDTIAPEREVPSRMPIWPVAAIVTLIAAVVAVVWLFPRPLRDRPGETPAGPGPVTSAPAAAEPAVSATAYSVEAALFRVGETGARERLESGAQLALGDKLSLEVEASEDLFVYVINEDERGRAYALFPLPNLDIGNPLPANRKHVLPGSLGGKPFMWEVDTPGGREHLLVLASPERLIEFEAGMNALPRPREGQGAMAIPQSTKMRLRGIGGLSEAPTAAAEGTAGRLFEMADELAGTAEVVEGVWVRRVLLENPAP